MKKTLDVAKNHEKTDSSDKSAKPQTSHFSSVEQAVAAIQSGQGVIMLDDESRENEGDVIFSAAQITPQQVTLMAREACGLICLALTARQWDQLAIPMQLVRHPGARMTAFGVSIEAVSGISTGISAADRARTIRVAADPQSSSADIAMPGHVFPLRAHPQGLLARQGHTEGSIALMQLAGVSPSAVICEVMLADGTMARRDDLLSLAERWSMPCITIAALQAYQQKRQPLQQARARLPVAGLGECELLTYQDPLTRLEHMALIKRPFTATPLVRVHSECVTGDVLGSTRCDCGAQLAAAKQHIAEQGGILIYLRQEGRGIGLLNKTRAYALQDAGMDTVEANQHLGFADDCRDYALAAQILQQIGIDKMRLLTNNPRKLASLTAHGMVVESCLPLVAVHENNKQYLQTKVNKLGHWIELEGAST